MSSVWTQTNATVTKDPLDGSRSCWNAHNLFNNVMQFAKSTIHLKYIPWFVGYTSLSEKSFEIVHIQHNNCCSWLWLRSTRINICFNVCVCVCVIRSKQSSLLSRWWNPCCNVWTDSCIFVDCSVLNNLVIPVHLLDLSYCVSYNFIWIIVTYRRRYIHK